MKKTYVATVAITAALVIVLAAAIAPINQPAQAKSGTLAVMGTDPPVTSTGISSATMSYSSVSAHTAGSDMSSGWVRVAGSGSMNLMANGTAQVLATSKVNATTYDAFMFDVNSISVVYNGQTYAATVASTSVTAASQSQVQVSSGSSAAALVDVRTFIQNTATTSNPQFVFSATAMATEVPSQASAAVSLKLGATLDLTGQAWFSSFETQTGANVTIVSATVASGALSIDLRNSGGASGQVQEVIITPASASVFASASLPSSLSGSAVFTVSGSGSVQQASSLQASTFTSSGATVAQGASSTIDYTGDIAMSGGLQPTGIVAGQQYIITCIGANTYASTTVVAS